MMVGTPVSDRLALDVIDFISTRATNWYGCDGSCSDELEIRFLDSERRRVSALLRFRVRVDGAERLILAKHYRPWRRQGGLQTVEPPRLFPPPAIEDKAPMEFAALSAIHEQIGEGVDTRFCAVRPLGVMPNERVIVMEYIPATTLDKMLCRCRPNSCGETNRQPVDVFHHSGALLREFHRLPSVRGCRPRQPAREDFIHHICQSIDYLARIRRYRSQLTQARDVLLERAAAILPEKLPLAWSHSDFAPRNVLIHPNGRLSVVDTLGRWEAPIYEDIGHFLVALETADAQMSSHGRALSAPIIASLKQEFVRGYYGSEEPCWDSIRLFEAQAILCKWTSHTAGYTKASGLVRLVKQVRLAAHSRFLARYLSHVVRELASR